MMIILTVFLLMTRSKFLKHLRCFFEITIIERQSFGILLKIIITSTFVYGTQEKVERYYHFTIIGS